MEQSTSKPDESISEVISSSLESISLDESRKDKDKNQVNLYFCMATVPGKIYVDLSGKK